MADREAKYDSAKRSRAVNMAFLRAAVAVYLLYLGADILRDYLRGGSTLPPALAWTAGLGFAAAALLFGFFTWKRLQTELAAARLPDDGEEPEE